MSVLTRVAGSWGGDEEGAEAREGRRKMVETASGSVYYEYEPGKIKLSDFATVGSR